MLSAAGGDRGICCSGPLRPERPGAQLEHQALYSGGRQPLINYSGCRQPLIEYGAAVMQQYHK